MKLSFRRNLGQTDRIIRASLGTGALYLATVDPLQFSRTWLVLLVTLGALLLLEALSGY